MLAAYDNYYISQIDLILGFLCGVIQLGFGFICITIGSRTTPSAIVGILMLAEAILGPFWAWLIVSEIPPKSALIGGAIIISAILLQFFYGKKAH